MANESFDQYQLILTGNCLPGFHPKKVALALVDYLKIPKEKASGLLSGQAVVLNKSVGHKKAYLHKQQLEALGAEVVIKPIVAFDKAPDFSMVPEGEEQTPFAQLQQKLESGEQQVQCRHCGCQQKSAAYCIECGKQLIGVSIQQMPEPEAKSANAWVWFLVVLLLAGGLAVAWYFLR